MTFYFILVKDDAHLVSDEEMEETKIERRDKEEKKYGLLAKSKVLEHCPIGSKIKLKTQKGKSKGKYGRILGELISQESVNVNNFLIDNNYGVDYHGFSKEEISVANKKISLDASLLKGMMKMDSKIFVDRGKEKSPSLPINVNDNNEKIS